MTDKTDESYMVGSDGTVTIYFTGELDADDEVDDNTAVSDLEAIATPTGDSNHITLWMILAIAAFTGVVIYGIIYRKKFK